MKQLSILKLTCLLDNRYHQIEERKKWTTTIAGNSFKMKKTKQSRKRNLRMTYDFISFYFVFVSDDQGPELPTRSNQEFRPFIRRLPEFKFWYAISKSTVIGIICTFFEVFNIPVFWPILVMYFITLFCITMKRQIKVSEEMHTSTQIKLFWNRLSRIKH